MIINEINKRGFSFIELMITITIMGIMTAAMLVSINNQRDKKAVEEAAREVTAAIHEAQSYALTGKNLAGQSACVYAFGWSGNSYNISDCYDQSFSLKNGVNFNNNGSFSFSVPFANLSSAADIVLQKNGNTYHVCVYISGVIKESLSGC